MMPPVVSLQETPHDRYRGHALLRCPGPGIRDQGVEAVRRQTADGAKAEVSCFNCEQLLLNETILRVPKRLSVRPCRGNLLSSQAPLSKLSRRLLEAYEVHHRQVVFKRKRIGWIPKQVRGKSNSQQGRGGNSGPPSS